MAWIYLIVAAALEAFWMFSLKFLSFDKFKSLTMSNFSQTTEMKIWLSLAGYIFFGAANTDYFSLAKKIFLLQLLSVSGRQFQYYSSK